MRRSLTHTLFPYTPLFRSSSTRRDIPTSPSRASPPRRRAAPRSEEHTSELQSRLHLVCRLLLEKKKQSNRTVSLEQWRPRLDVFVLHIFPWLSRPSP